MLKWNRGIDVLKVMGLLAEGLDLIAKLAKNSPAHKAADALRVIDQTIDKLRDGVEGKVAIKDVQAALANLERTLAANDATANAALAAKFGALGATPAVHPAETSPITQPRAWGSSSAPHEPVPTDGTLVHHEPAPAHEPPPPISQPEAWGGGGHADPHAAPHVAPDDIALEDLDNQDDAAPHGDATDLGGHDVAGAIDAADEIDAWGAVTAADTHVPE